jgi:predicted enzyme related to lactoylglutathione lyase
VELTHILVASDLDRARRFYVDVLRADPVREYGGDVGELCRRSPGRKPCAARRRIPSPPPFPETATVADGEIRYLQIPAADVEASAGFYETVFGWGTRENRDGERAFDDPSGHVSGTWVLGRTPAREPGVLVWVLVDSVEVTLEKITKAGGEVVSPISPQHEGEAVAAFRDPAGNVLGIFHQ